MYRKFTADRIFTGKDMLPSGNVLITDTVGKVLDIISTHDAGDGIEIIKGFLCPGFINCHSHLELSHMKGHIPRHTGMVDFVLQVVKERHFIEEEILEAINLAEEQMLKNGIVAAGDICNNDLSIEQKKKGRLHYQNFIEVSGFPPTIAEHRFKKAIELYDKFSRTLPCNSIVPHAPYSVSPALMSHINNFPGNSIISMHNQESVAEDDLFIRGSGDFLRMFENMDIDISFFKPSGYSGLQGTLPLFKQKQIFILVHNVHSSAQDIAFSEMLQTKTGLQVFYCFCPNANLYISGNLPNLLLFVKNQDQIVLGTDSLASNSALSILEEIKTILKNFPAIGLKKALQWATFNGAKALGIEKRYGSFEKGKQPGVLCIEMNEKEELEKVVRLI